MKINSIKQNNFYLPNFKQKLEQNNTPKTQQNSTVLPSCGVSSAIVQPQIPVQYQKIAEIPILGLKENASVFKMSNGQTVVIAPKKGKFYIKTKFNVGSNNETEDIKGISHFIEHNLFAGSKDLKPKEFDKKAQILGAESNAATSRTRTEYFMSGYLLDDDSLENYIKLNANLTQFPTFNNEYVTNEKGVVKSEIDSSLDDELETIMGKCLKNLYNIKYKNGDILGSKENIDSFTREQLFDYYNTYYTPDNTTTIIVGDVDTDETMKLVSKYFNKKPDYSNVSKRNYPILTTTNKPIRNDFISKTAKLSTCQIALAMPDNLSEEDKIKLDIMRILLNRENSKISKQLEEKDATFSIEKPFEINKNSKVDQEALLVNVISSEENIEDSINTVLNGMTEFMNGNYSASDLELVKRQLLESINAKKQDEYEIVDLVETVLDNKNPLLEQKLSNSIQQINPKTFGFEMRKLIDFNKMSMVVNHAKDTTKDEIENNYSNQKQTTTTLNNQISFTSKKQVDQMLIDDINSIRSYYLQNNFRINTVNTPNTNTTNLMFDFFTDKFQDVPRVQLDLLETMLNLGPSNMSKDAFLDYTIKNDPVFVTIENSGITFNTFSDKSSNIENNIKIMKQIMASPNFDEKEFQKTKERMKKDILIETETLTDKETAIMYPNYSMSKEERLNILEKTSLDDIKRLYALLWQNCSAEATISSDFSKNSPLVDTLNKELFSYPTFKVFDKTKDYYTKTFAPNQKEITITKPTEKTKSDINMIFNFEAPKDDFMSLKISLLKDVLSRRLFDELRNKQGLVYGAGAMQDFINNISEIRLYTDVAVTKKEEVENILNAFKQEVEKLKTTPITEDELKTIKNSDKTEILDIINDEISSFIKHTSQSGEKDGIYSLYNEMKLLDKITPQDIQQAAQYVFKNPPITSIETSQKILDEMKN